MGIKNLQKLIDEICPQAVTKSTVRAYHGKVIAIDTSALIYKFLTVSRTKTGELLMNSNGEATSHIGGLLSRSIYFMEMGIKPVWVFDGEAPEAKAGELLKRKEIKQKAEAGAAEALARGEEEIARKLLKRTTRMTKKNSEDAARALRLIGAPVIISPSEGESQCAELCKAGLCDGVASEDRDTLTFGSPKLLVNFLASQKQGLPVLDISHEAVVKGLELTEDQFVDLCILCGCDYTEPITGMGHITAYRLIKQYGNIETVLRVVKAKKQFKVPEVYPYELARTLFKHPDVTPGTEIAAKTPLTWNRPHYTELSKFLIDEMSFTEAHVQSLIKRMKAARREQTQATLTSFLQFEQAAEVDKKRVNKVLHGRAKKGFVKGGRSTGGSPPSSPGPRPIIRKTTE